MTPVGMIVAAVLATIILIPGLEAKATDARRIVVEIRGFQFIPEAAGYWTKSETLTDCHVVASNQTETSLRGSLE